MATTYNTLSTQATQEPIATTSTETINGTTYNVYTYSSAKTFSNDLIILPTDKLVFYSQTCTFNCNVINCGIFYINGSTCRIKDSKNFTNLHGSFYYSNEGTTEFEGTPESERIPGIEYGVTMRSYDCTIDISYPHGDLSKRGDFKVQTGSTANHYMYKVTPTRTFASDGLLFNDSTSGWTGTGTQTIATAMLLTDTNHFSGTASNYTLSSNLILSNDTYLWIKPDETLTIHGGNDHKELTCPTRACIINNGTINAGESVYDYESAKFLIQGNITNTYVINIYHHLDLYNTSSNSAYLTLFNSGTINNYYNLFLQGKVINTNSIIHKNDDTFVSSNSNHQLFINAITPTCFYGFVKIITKDGLKEIKDLKRGELVLTNDGYQPLARLVYSLNFREYKGKQQMVKIPKDFFTKNIPNEDIYTTDTHPLSVKVLSEKEDTDFEYLHLFVKELIGLNNDDKKIKYEYLEEEKYMYNLVFDKHYELNIGGVKFLSHHPNHNNGNLRLSNGNEIDPNNRSKKVYADKKGIYFKRITLKKLLKDKPEQMSDKEYIVSLIQF